MSLSSSAAAVFPWLAMPGFAGPEYNRIEEVFTTVHPSWNEPVGVQYATRGRQTHKTKRIAAAVVCSVAAACLFVSLQRSSPETPKVHSGLSQFTGSENDAATMSLFSAHWGLLNPETGIPRVQCGDSVATGRSAVSSGLQSWFAARMLCRQPNLTTLVIAVAAGAACL